MRSIFSWLRRRRGKITKAAVTPEELQLRLQQELRDAYNEHATVYQNFVLKLSPPIRIKTPVLTKLVNEFTHSGRIWTAYPADTIELILRHKGIIPKNYFYSTFDPDTEEAVFTAPPPMFDDHVDTGVPPAGRSDSPIRRFSIWLYRKTQRRYPFG